MSVARLDFYPLSGETPGEFDDCVETFPVEEREDGIYVGFPPAAIRERTVSDVIVETLANWELRQVWGIVGHSNLGLADAIRERGEHGDLRYYGVRHEGGETHATRGDHVLERGDYVTFIGQREAVRRAVKRFHPHD